VETNATTPMGIQAEIQDKIRKDWVTEIHGQTTCLRLIGMPGVKRDEEELNVMCF
jgi:hypothetical protein